MPTVEAIALRADSLVPLSENYHAEGPILRAILADDDTFARVMRWANGTIEVEVYQHGAKVLDWNSLQVELTDKEEHQKG